KAVNRRVVFQHVQNESLLNRLLHRINVKSDVFYLVARRCGIAEHFQSLVLWCGSEREIARVWQHLFRFDNPVDGILDGFLLLFLTTSSEGDVHFCRYAPALAGMCFVNDDGKLPSPMFAPDLIQNDREFLDGRYDYLFSI